MSHTVESELRRNRRENLAIKARDQQVVPYTSPNMHFNTFQFGLLIIILF